MGIFDTPLRPNTCDPSKYRCDSSTRHVLPFEKLSCFRPLRGRAVGRIRYAPTTEYVRSFKIPMQFSNWVRVRVQKMDLYTPPSVAYGGAYAIRPYDRVCAALRKTTPFSSPSGPWSGRMRYAPTTGYVRGFKKRICICHRRWRLVGVCNTPLQLDTCCPSKNHPVFVPFGDVCGEYSIRPYDRVRAILRNIDAIPQPGTCDPSKYRCNFSTGHLCSFKKQSRFRPLRGRGVGRMRYAPTTGYVWPFKKQSRFRLLRGRRDGRIQYAPTAGYVRFFEIPMRFLNWVRMILWNTDEIPQSATCDPMKYRRDLSIGGAGVFGM